MFYILLLLLVYILVGFYPFEFKAIPSGQVNNGVISTPDQGLHFRSPGIAYTGETPPWYPHAIVTSGLELSLEVRTSDREQTGPARIFTFSLDNAHRNLTVGQLGTDLVVRMRHGYTSLNGTPHYAVKDVFTDTGWHLVDIHITSKTLEIRVDGKTLAVAPMPDRHLESWDPDYRLALGNELSGNRPWLGSIRKAVVRVGDESYDYLAPDALHIPETFTMENKYRVIKLVPFVIDGNFTSSLAEWGINFLLFVPLGWLLVMYRRPRPAIFLATITAAGISAAIETTQLLFLFDRYAATDDLILNTLGGAMGAFLAEHFEFSVRRRPTHAS